MMESWPIQLSQFATDVFKIATKTFGLIFFFLYRYWLRLCRYYNFGIEVKTKFSIHFKCIQLKMTCYDYKVEYCSMF